MCGGKVGSCISFLFRMISGWPFPVGSYFLTGPLNTVFLITLPVKRMTVCNVTPLLPDPNSPILKLTYAVPLVLHKVIRAEGIVWSRALTKD